jgi:hypothetical protein
MLAVCGRAASFVAGTSGRRLDISFAALSSTDPDEEACHASGSIAPTQGEQEVPSD